MAKCNFLGEDEIKQKGYQFKIPEIKKYNISIINENIPENIRDVDESIINEIIECFHKGNCSDLCTTAFKITKEELQFYKNLNLPLPRLCPSCRHFRRVNLKNPMKLWNRACMCDKSNHDHGDKCKNEFKTPYSSDRPEIIYCETCYQKEIL